MIPRSEITRIPGAKFLESVQSTAKPFVEEMKSRIESPDAQGKSEKYFAALSHPEKKEFLIDELIEASRVLTALSFDFEENLDFYNRAPDVELKKHILNIIFPEQPKVEKPHQTAIRIIKELGSGKPKRPNPRTKTGSGEQWRRRVILAIETLLTERRGMAKIEKLWDHPDDQVREKFRKSVFYNVDLTEEPDVIFTPFALIVNLNDKDFTEVVDKKIHGDTIEGSKITQGSALRTHHFLHLLSHRIVFIRKSENNNMDVLKTTRHELFHLYFTHFIRKKGLSQVKEHPEILPRVTTPEDVRKLLPAITDSLNSTLLEETAAYMFNDDRVVHPGLAKGNQWETFITYVHENLSGQTSENEIKLVITDIHKAQAQYLKKARGLQMSLHYLLASIIQDNETRSKDKLSQEEIHRNLLFLVSQWGPHRMDQFSKILGIDQKLLQERQNKFELKNRAKMQKVLFDLHHNIYNTVTKKLLKEVTSISKWLYAEHDIPQMIELCSLLITKNENNDYIETLLITLQNSLLVREQPLSQDEVNSLSKLVDLLHVRAKQGTIRLHYKTLARLIEEFSQKK